MRNISFALTTDQVRAGKKTVTRRLGWQFLRPGDYLHCVEKTQGIPKGQKVQSLGVTVRIVSTRREPLYAITKADVVLEGFPDMTPFEFVTMFCQHNPGCTGQTEITRIEFEYVEAPR